MKTAAFTREPLLHFALLAVVLFAMGALFGSDDDVIEVSRSEIEWRILRLEAERGSPLSADERRLVEQAYIDERVLVREARALGLAEDERIDDILVQKMLHVLSADVIQPTDDELAAYYGARQERYRRPERVSVDELVVEHGASLPRTLREGAEPEDLPPGSVVGHRMMPRLAESDLILLFGDESAASIFAAESGVWVSAYGSVRGDHWFRVNERLEEETPPLDEVRDLVRRDWIVEEEEERLARRVAELRERYTVVVDNVR